MQIRKIFRYLRYLYLNPDYFFYYFYGRPEKIIHAVTGQSESSFFEFKRQLDNDLLFVKGLRERTFKVTGMNFNLDMDHYFLYALVRTIKPAVILETGVFHGYYTACFLKGIHDNYKELSVDGRVVSIDLPAYESIPESTHTSAITHLPSGYEPGWVIPDYLKDRWQLNIGDSSIKSLLTSLFQREGQSLLWKRGARGDF